MFIQTQDQQNLINVNHIHMLYIKNNEIYADYVLLGSYTGQRRLQGVFSLCKTALCKSMMSGNNNGIYTAEDFCYEMPADNEKLDKHLDLLDHIQKDKDDSKRIRNQIYYSEVKGDKK